MKNKVQKTTYREKRQVLSREVLPRVRELVNKFDLASVQSAVKALYDERKAEKQLKDAEDNILALKRKLGK